MMRPDMEGGRESGLARHDEDLTSNSSGGNSLPSADADITIAHSPVQAITAKARAAVRRVLKPSVPVPAPGAPTAEEDLAGNALTANPTRDSDTIITWRPRPAADGPAGADDDPTTVTFGVKLRGYIETMGAPTSRRPVVARAVTFGMLVTLSAGTVSVLGVLDVISRTAHALWAGLTIAFVGLVIGLGVWVVERRRSR